MTIFKATLETRNFSFEAYGTDEVNAQTALEVGLRNHARQYKLKLDWYVGFDIDVSERELGKCYRDREEMK